MRSRTTFLISGLLGILICGGAWIEARNMPFQTIDAGLGPAFFPYLLLGCLLILSIGMIGYAIMAPSGERTTSPGAARLRAPALLFIVMAAFGLSIERLDAIVATYAFLSLSMIILGERWPRALVYAAVVTALIYLLFGVAFGLAIFT